MGIFNQSKQILCKANIWTKIISDFAKGFPEDISVKFVNENNELIKGVYEEKHYNWIFPKTPVTGSVKENMIFQRRWIDGTYSVSVKLENDAIAYVRS